MSDHHDGPPAWERLGEGPRWLDRPSNLRRLKGAFFSLCAVLLLADLVFLAVHRHAAFGEGETATATGLAPRAEGWTGFYPVYGLLGIVVLVALSVVLRKVVMRPEDHYDA